MGATIETRWPTRVNKTISINTAYYIYVYSAVIAFIYFSFLLVSILNCEISKKIPKREQKTTTENALCIWDEKKSHKFIGSKQTLLFRIYYSIYYCFSMFSIECGKMMRVVVVCIRFIVQLVETNFFFFPFFC